MKFLGISLINHTPDPLTGEKLSTTDRFSEVVDNVVLFEELGFDGFGVGERHHAPFISTAPPVVLSHFAALTSTIRLFSAVTLLSVLDPVRVAEDYATLDHLSGGRLELFQSAVAPELRRTIADRPWPAPITPLQRRKSFR